MYVYVCVSVRVSARSHFLVHSPLTQVHCRALAISLSIPRPFSLPPSLTIRVLQCPSFPESQAEIRYQVAIRHKPKEKELDGQLRIRVIEAKNLPAMDWGGTSGMRTKRALKTA